jgi:uncharacterized protein with HEPN domain
MSTKREVRDYLNDILESIGDIHDFTRSMTYAEFSADRKTVKAVIRCLEVIGEAAKKIPAETRASYSALPWTEIAGMRDKLIHEYFGVDLEIVWETINNDLDGLETATGDILKKLSGATTQR